MHDNVQPNSLPDMMDVAGIHCYVHDTTALEAWFMMNSLRQVICADEPPAQRGTLALVVSQPLLPKEEDFIVEMSRTGECPSLDKFLEISGLVGVVDFHVEKTTDLPGWDGTSIPVILSNPRWYRDGELVPAPPPFIIPDDHDTHERRPRRERRRWRR